MLFPAWPKDTKKQRGSKEAFPRWDTRRLRSGDGKLLGQKNGRKQDEGQDYRQVSRHSIKQLLRLEISQKFLMDAGSREESFSDANALMEGEQIIAVSMIDRHSMIVRTSLGRTLVLNN